MALGYHRVTLDKERRLRFDFNALADVEAVLGAGVGHIFKEENMGFNSLRALYWAALKWEDKGLTLDRTGKILQKVISEDIADMSQLGEYLTEAMYAGGIIKRKPEGEESEEDNDDEENEKN